jgi:hypothetical protein
MGQQDTHLGTVDRNFIHSHLNERLSQIWITNEIGRARSAISREIRRNRGTMAGYDALDALVRAARRQVQADLGLHLDHARGDLDEALSQSVELGHCKARAFQHRGAQVSPRPVGAGKQEQRKLVCRRFCAGGAVGGLSIDLGRAQEDTFTFQQNVSIRSYDNLYKTF